MYLNICSSFQRGCVSWQGFSHWILKRSLALQCYKNISKDWKDAINSFISKHCLINRKLLLKDLFTQVSALFGCLIPGGQTHLRSCASSNDFLVVVLRYWPKSRWIHSFTQIWSPRWQSRRFTSLFLPLTIALLYSQLGMAELRTRTRTT